MDKIIEMSVLFQTSLHKQDLSVFISVRRFIADSHQGYSQNSLSGISLGYIDRLFELRAECGLIRSIRHDWSVDNYLILKGNHLKRSRKPVYAAN